MATHNASGSSCYNGLHMPHLDLSNGTIFFACTYTAMWSNNKSLGANLWSTCLFGSRLGSSSGCVSKMMNFCIKNEELCIKNEELCI